MKYPYWLVVLIGLDRLAAAIFFNRPDITVSALGWVVHFAHSELVAAAALRDLAMYRWQARALLWIGDGLELLQPGHCAYARASDTITAKSTVSLLQ